MPRRAVTVRGIVQGVGFRPHVCLLAGRWGLQGFVKNRTDGVLIEVEGDTAALDAFVAALAPEAPPMARVEQIDWRELPPLNDGPFRIESSDARSSGPILIGADAATCDDCLRELFDPADRRYRYPFLNCTNCGPRLTIILAAPYDRERTTMASFRTCQQCQAEYDDPSDRRFHAQPIACPACGPRLAWRDADGRANASGEPLSLAVDALSRGRIVAIKGLGGYHLACDAGREEAVAELRRRKRREEKPFAVMVHNLGAVRELCEVSQTEADLLLSRQRPIVLLRRRGGVANSVAPGNSYLGVMLPYAPLHHLLLADLGGMALVMTSGNRSDEPIAFNDDDAMTRLSGVADHFLTNDREIHVRCDDSVTRVVDGQELPFRRSRGHAPQPITLPVACPHPILALGGQLKAAFALGRGRHALLSHHLGDLDHLEAYRAYVEAIEHYERLFALRPECLVCDAHPDYASTRYALERAAADGSRLIAVQHHHAHLASCMAEHGLTWPVLGVTFDGTGYGSDGAIWGGEFLLGDYRDFRRVAHLRYVSMPGGDAAIREPWRMALAHLLDAGYDGSDFGIASSEIRVVGRMIERRLNAPLTSSVGRLFDAVAYLTGRRRSVRFEGQAAMELEWLASACPADGVTYPFAIEEASDTLVIDVRPLIGEVVREVRAGVTAATIARRFHATLVEMIAVTCGRVRAATGVDEVALSGGVFQNALLLTETTARLEGEGFRVYRHRLVPPNDGGLCLGQVAVAAVISQQASGGA